MTSFGIVYFSQYVIFLSKFFLCIRVGTLLIVARIHKCQFELNPSPFLPLRICFCFYLLFRVYIILVCLIGGNKLKEHEI